jgi:hypothetical protein
MASFFLWFCFLFSLFLFTIKVIFRLPYLINKDCDVTPF